MRFYPSFMRNEIPYSFSILRLKSLELELRCFIILHYLEGHSLSFCFFKFGLEHKARTNKKQRSLLIDIRLIFVAHANLSLTSAQKSMPIIE